MIDWATIDWGSGLGPVNQGDEGQSSMELMETTTCGGGGGESRGLGCVLDGTYENPIGVTIFPASLRPPPLTDDGEDGIPWVLLDLKAYIADRPNATTARSFTRAGQEIHATLCAAGPPPRVSHLCVHCPALTPSDFGTEPFVLATGDDGLILFQAAICNTSVFTEHAMQDFFVYHAAAAAARPMEERRTAPLPLLTLLPHPGPSCYFAASQVGILRGGGGGLQAHGQQHYVIAALCTARNTPVEEKHLRYDLHRFDSGAGEWTTDALQLGPMEPSPGLTFFYHQSDKVITLPGGFIGWVDISRGILLCNVLTEHPELRYIAFPEPLLHDEAHQEEVKTDRDIAVVHGRHIKLVEHQTQCEPWSHFKGTYISDNWTTATYIWKMNPGCCCWDGHWVEGYTYDASRLSGSSLSELLGDEDATATPLPPLPRLHTGRPTISLDDDDVVYFGAKVDHRDDEAFVLAVNMREGTLQGAERFNAERMVGLRPTYTQSRMFASALGRSAR